MDMTAILKLILLGAAAVFGAAAGAVAAFFATYCACMLMDRVGGGTAGMTAGWAYLFLTVPAGSILGGCAGVGLAARRPRMRRSGERGRASDVDDPA